jgi:hypothetical protein
MADTSERIIILSAVILVVIFVRSIQMYSVEPTYEIIFQEGSEGSSISLWVPDKARNESAWIKALRLTVKPSPTLEIVELSSKDKDILLSLFQAIDKALEVEFSQEAPTPEGPQRMYKISSIDAESIIHYLGGEIEMDRLSYEFYVSHANTTYSILIQFFSPLVTS